MQEDVKQLALEMLQLSVKAIRQAQACADARGDRAEHEILGKKLRALDWLQWKAMEGE